MDEHETGRIQTMVLGRGALNPLAQAEPGNSVTTLNPPHVRFSPRRPPAETRLSTAGRCTVAKRQEFAADKNAGLVDGRTDEFYALFHIEKRFQSIGLRCLT